MHVNVNTKELLKYSISLSAYGLQLQSTYSLHALIIISYALLKDMIFFYKYAVKLMNKFTFFLSFNKFDSIFSNPTHYIPEINISIRSTEPIHKMQKHF